jgi:hypothetical protein
VGAGHDFVRVEPVLDGPSPPHARDGGCGVDEDSIHVEEKSGAVDLDHAVRPDLRRYHVLQMAWWASVLKTILFRSMVSGGAISRVVASLDRTAGFIVIWERL